MKIRTYLALMACAVLIPVLAFSAFALDMLLDSEREAALLSMQELARATSLAVDGEFARSEGVVRALAISRSLADGDLATFYEQAKRANAGRGSNVTLFEASGDRVFTTVVPFADRLPPLPAASRERALKVFDATGPQISDLIQGRVTGQFLASVEMPVTLKDGRRYLVSQWNYASFFKTLLPKERVAKSWLIAVFDRSGRTVVRNVGPEDFVGKFPKDDLLQAIRSGKVRQIRNETRDGIAVYTALARSPVSGWTVAVGVPVGEIEAAAQQAVFLSGLGLLAALVCALAAAYVFGSRLTRATRHAEASAASLGKGDIPAPSTSEVRELDNVLTAMHRAGVQLHEVREQRLALLEEAEQGRARAEAQNRAKDEFLAMLGHELRNPLAAVSAGVGLIEAPGTPAAVRQRAQEIVARQCRHLSAIVDDLLDASRIISGKVSLSKEIVDLAEVARSSMSTIQLRNAAAASRTVEIRTQSALVDADVTRLEQMIGNLLENAFKYTPEGGTITMTVEAADGEAVLTVRDTGIGMNPDLLPTVFDMFVQAPRRNRAQGGLGIGLAVVRELATRHGASLTAHSAGEGMGSSFMLRFPLAHAGGKDTAPNQERAAPAQIEKIVLVEDNDDLRDMVSQLLKAHGLEVLEAKNGLDAVELILAQRPTLALVDIDLPDISGFDVATRLRSAGLSGTRLIAVTGYGQESDRRKALEAGFDAHLKKPLDLDALMAIIAA